jgi:glycosyltransferase involved in cell wall biosynthesis
MRVLIALTYYRPHTSGLTIYAERLAQALVKRGHQVTVLTSQYDIALPRDENVNGVRVFRVPVMLRLSKGVLMPSFGYHATRLVMESDVINLHLPQFDAAGLALRGRIFKKPTIVTYHCDLRMPSGLLNLAANWAVRAMNNLTEIFTHRIVTYTRDYAENSSHLKKYLKKLRVIPPPVELPDVTPAMVEAFHRENNPLNHRPVIGMAARFASEKGVEVLLRAIPHILKEYPDSLVLFAGQYKNIMGEESYLQRFMPAIQEFEKRGVWKFLGNLTPQQLATFYPNLDILTIPSLNSTEAFGLVQIEAMINGIPCIASDLPGVRQPVLAHGMGKIIPIGDSDELARAVLNILASPDMYRNDPKQIAIRYSPASVAEEYEKLFKEISNELNNN